jgi:serine/threonine protein kinase
MKTDVTQMKHICSRCKLASDDGNLWCQQVDCPAGSLPMLFNYGDYLGNMKILQLKRVLRTATLYQVERKGELFFLKVANPGVENETYIKREAQALRHLKIKKVTHASLPVWRHHGAVNGQDAFGKVNFGDQAHYYYLMEYVEGEFLTDTLVGNSQPWHEHVGWFLLTLTQGLLTLRKSTQTLQFDGESSGARLHLNLNPDVILVTRNNAEVPQPVLLDLGLLLHENTLVPASELERYQNALLPAYTPRELVEGGTLTEYTDVYGLGLILYEMLEGKPAYAHLLRRTEDIYADIRQIDPVLKRGDLPIQPRNAKRRFRGESGSIEPLTEIVQRAVRRDHPNRYHSLSDLWWALYHLYGDVEDKFRFNFSQFFRKTGVAIALSAVVLFILFVLIVLFTAITSPVVASLP